MAKNIVPHRTDFSELSRPTKTIFLDDANLATLKGYKATVICKGCLFGKPEIVVAISGLSVRGAERLFSDLKRFDLKEYCGGC